MSIFFINTGIKVYTGTYKYTGTMYLCIICYYRFIFYFPFSPVNYYLVTLVAKIGVDAGEILPCLAENEPLKLCFSFKLRGFDCH